MMNLSNNDNKINIKIIKKYRHTSTSQLVSTRLPYQSLLSINPSFKITKRYFPFEIEHVEI